MFEIVDDIRILGSTFTQTRRLGYIVQICRLLGENPSPRVILTSELEKWAKNNNYHLANHVSSKGILRQSSRSYGAMRYINLAEDLGLIIELSGYFRNTIIGEIISSFCGHTSKENNPFSLPNKISLLLIYQILLTDADYILEIISLTKEFEEQKDIIINFQDGILDRFQIMESLLPSSILRSEIYNRIRSIRKWKKPIDYLEHVVTPRLNWLVDLRIYNQNSFSSLKVFELSELGKDLINNTPNYKDHNFINLDWCRNQLFPIWALSENQSIRMWNALSNKEQSEFLITYIKDGFNKFGTTNKQRLSAKQLFLFMMVNLIFEDNIVVTFDELIKTIRNYSNYSSPRWNFHWSYSDKDGYLLRT